MPIIKIDYSQNHNKKLIGELQMPKRLKSIICSCLSGFGPTDRKPVSALSEIQLEEFKSYRGVGPVTIADLKKLFDSIGMELK